MDFQQVQRFPEITNERLELWIWYADKIPPHIGCSASGQYFSLKSNGKDVRIPVEKVASLVRNKKIPFLLVSVNISFDPDDIYAAYSNYTGATSSGPTCLTPILELLETPSHVTQLNGLLNYLNETDGIKHIFGYNLPLGYQGIPSYGENEIRSRLSELENVKRKHPLPSIR
ncbi:MAG: hypothetical protein ACK45H_06445 [Bacteroidota bacterium]|jgi:hypothetical protein